MRNFARDTDQAWERNTINKILYESNGYTRTDISQVCRKGQDGKWGRGKECAREREETTKAGRKREGGMGEGKKKEKIHV
ncbi:MAG TPA: hypothetical protein VGO47_02225, partial [Chlamydiales bacterium]|nr:hypothetical protein [Chlamydiales bacterium]